VWANVSVCVFMCMCVCTYICVCVYIYIYIYIYQRIEEVKNNVRVRAHMYTHTHKHTMETCICICACTVSSLFKNVFVCIHAYMYICISRSKPQLLLIKFQKNLPGRSEKTQTQKPSTFEHMQRFSSHTQIGENLTAVSLPVLSYPYVHAYIHTYIHTYIQTNINL
jgi:hypothetical protein